jgi:hypothetical protein
VNVGDIADIGGRLHSPGAKGGLVRVVGQGPEIVAAARSTIAVGPDRVRLLPIPAMSMASHAAGARFISMLGGAMLSFYDWYADLPVASPQVFGDQTDVPESADWFNASYLIMWGSNVPVTRTPDAHFMTEARYRGQKVVVVSPDYADNTKFADEWLSLAPERTVRWDGDGPRHAHEFSSMAVPFFVDYATLHKSAVPGPLEGARRPSRRNLTPPTSAHSEAAFKPSCRGRR